MSAKDCKLSVREGWGGPHFPSSTSKNTSTTRLTFRQPSLRWLASRILYSRYHIQLDRWALRLCMFYRTTRVRKKVEMFELYLISIKVHTTQYSLAQTKELRTLGLEGERREHDLRCSAPSISSRTITRIIRFQQNQHCLFSYA